LAGVPDSREFRGHGASQGVHRERQKEIAAQLFEAMDIGWDDKARRKSVDEAAVFVGFDDA
jgi:hypothetical protein